MARLATDRIMAFHDFNPNFKSKHATGEAVTDFPFEEVYRRLDGEPSEPLPDSTQPNTAEMLSLLMEWLKSDCKAREDERAVNYIGKRAIAAIWVVKPELFGNVAGHMVAKSFGISSFKFSKAASEFGRVFGIRNCYQRHDAKNKPARRTKHKEAK